MKCPNCKKGIFKSCFYCGSLNDCSFCEWGDGDDLPKNMTLKQAIKNKICCLCCGTGMIDLNEFEEQDQEIMLSRKIKCPECDEQGVDFDHNEDENSDVKYFSCPKCENEFWINIITKEHYSLGNVKNV